MLYFVHHRRNSHPLHEYLRCWGLNRLWQILPLTYEDLLTRSSDRPGVYVFTDIELIDSHTRHVIGRRVESWCRQPRRYAILNDPRHALGRFELLTALHQAGINSYRAWRASEQPQPARWPVFVRREDDHAGGLELLYSPLALRQALQDLRQNKQDLRHYLVVEYCDSRTPTGETLKFGAFVVGGEIIPRHAVFGRHWMLKVGGRLPQERYRRWEWQYLLANPHAARLRKVSRLAGIDYGRIDYGLSQHGIEVWEINTNPMIIDPQDVSRPRHAVNAWFHAQLDPVLARLAARVPDALRREILSRRRLRSLRKMLTIGVGRRPDLLYRRLQEILLAWRHLGSPAWRGRSGRGPAPPPKPPLPSRRPPRALSTSLEWQNLIAY